MSSRSCSLVINSYHYYDYDYDYDCYYYQEFPLDTVVAILGLPVSQEEREVESTNYRSA